MLQSLEKKNTYKFLKLKIPNYTITKVNILKPIRDVLNNVVIFYFYTN